MKRNCSVLCAVLAVLLMLSGCGGRKQEVPDLQNLGKIDVVEREDGSGTKTQFEDLLGIAGGSSETTASSTEDAEKAVGSDRSSIGYAALGALTGSDQVKVLSVDGITPSARTIRSRKYPLSRNYYLAWQGNLSDLEREFLTYVRSAGQKTVAEEAVPVAKESSFLSMKPSGTLKIGGSTSIAPLLETLAEDYESRNPNATVTVTATDSTEGLRDAMQGKIDFAMSSRELKDYEKELLSYRAIASDGIAVIVNAENPLDDISLSQVRDIFGGKTENWSDLK